ncbi:MAG: phosphonate ABC transporter ATP-binding protein [Magnetospiraceae bacterium]
MSPAIEVKKLSKTFRRSGKALDDVSLLIEPGEMVALIGASGSGKSTLLRHMAGLVHADATPDCCQVTVRGHVIQRAGKLSRSARKSRAEIGFVFQQFNLVGRLSVLTNVCLGFLGSISGFRGTLGLFSKSEKLQAMEALHRVGIGRTATQRASTLSGGQQQRAAIARTLVQGAQLILADEPIASLDPASSVRVMENLREINRQDGITVVVSLHQVEYAKKYCPRTVALRDGKIVFDGPSEALVPEFLMELYGAESEELLVEDHPKPKTANSAADMGDDALALAGAV